MEKENIGQMVDSALLNGIIESECMQCANFASMRIGCNPGMVRQLRKGGCGQKRSGQARLHLKEV
jgi:hypothetical protein